MFPYVDLVMYHVFHYCNFRCKTKNPFCFFLKHTQPANTARKAKLISQFVSFSSRHPCVLSQVAFQATEKAPVNMCCRTTSLSSFKPCAAPLVRHCFQADAFLNLIHLFPVHNSLIQRDSFFVAPVHLGGPSHAV